jgi:hypothetical protein
MRFYPQMLALASSLTADGWIVLAPFVTVDPADQHTGAKVALDELHRRKINLSDRVIIVTDRAGYIGESTRGEIAYATERGIPIEYHRPAVPVGDVVQHAARLVHSATCPDCWGWPDCPSPAEAERDMAAADAVLSYGWGATLIHRSEVAG